MDQAIGHEGRGAAVLVRENRTKGEWAFRLKRGPIEVYPGLQTARIPMVDAASGQEINWAIEHLPSLDQTAGEPEAGHRETDPCSTLSTPAVLHVAKDGIRLEPGDRTPQAIMAAELSAQCGVQT